MRRWAPRLRARPRSHSVVRLDLDNYHYLHATQAELLSWLNRTAVGQLEAVQTLCLRGDARGSTGVLPDPEACIVGLRVERHPARMKPSMRAVPRGSQQLTDG